MLCIALRSSQPEVCGLAAPLQQPGHRLSRNSSSAEPKMFVFDTADPRQSKNRYLTSERARQNQACGRLLISVFVSRVHAYTITRAHMCTHAPNQRENERAQQGNKLSSQFVRKHREIIYSFVFFVGWTAHLICGPWGQAVVIQAALLGLVNSSYDKKTCSF